MRLSKKMQAFILVSCVLILFAFTRFYNLQHRIMFDWDQERDAWQIYDLFVHYKPTLIGPRVVGPNGFFLPPYFTYLLAPFYLVTRLHPSAMIVFLATYNIVFFFAGFWFLKKLFDFKNALFFMLLWTSNSLLAQYDVISWNPVVLPICILGTWYLLDRIKKNPSYGNLAILGATMTVSISMHFQYIFVMLQVFLFMFLMKPKIISINLKKSVVFLGSILAPLLPIAVFDLRHNFLNSRLFLNFFFLKREIYSGASYTIWVEVWSNFLKPLTYVKSIYISVAIFVVLFAMTIFLAKKSKGFLKLFFSSSLIVWVSMPIFFTLYKNRPSEYYFTFMYLYMFITTVMFFSHIKKPHMMTAIIVLLFVLNIQQLRTNLKDSLHPLYAKDQAIQKLKTLVEGRIYNVSFDVPLGRDNGYRYLLEYYKIPPSKVDSDPLFQIRIPPKENDVEINGIGIMIPKAYTK